jgi:ubiquinone/menaquinone biosynthesis C-methylase UbiE
MILKTLNAKWHIKSSDVWVSERFLERKHKVASYTQYTRLIEQYEEIGHNWKEYFIEIDLLIDSYFKDKTLRILDVSGAPGFLAKYLSDKGHQVVVTEFSAEVCEKMTSKLGIDSICFDYQEHDISQLTSTKFDLVIINFSLNYCLDFNRFINNLSNILNKEARVLINCVLPSIGTINGWTAFFNYPYLVLRGEDELVKTAKEAGFKICVSEVYSSFPYYKGSTGKIVWKYVGAGLFFILTNFINILQLKKYRSIIQCNYRMIIKRE